MSIRVMISEDLEMVRWGLTSLLAGTEFEVVGLAASCPQTLELARSNRPDLVLLDVRLPRGEGLDVLSQLRGEFPEVPVIMLCCEENPGFVARANTQGASDYLLKRCSRDELLTCMRAVISGNGPSACGEFRRAAAGVTLRAASGNSAYPLTTRETQVLKHIALGLSNREIGGSLSISVETVKEHVQNILRKVKAVDRTQAAVWAVRNGIA
jgi:DNA-binding NarL/FixJ family response regulator